MSLDMCIEKAIESNHLKEKSQGKSSLAEDMRFYEKSENLHKICIFYMMP